MLVDDQPYNILAMKTILQFSVGIKNIDLISDEALDGKEAVELIK